jgi:arylesterase / paraoxonase
MKSELATAFALEMAAARAAFAAGDDDKTFALLERAHILGQRALLPHILTHWRMLMVGMRRADRREIIGQVTRCIGAVFFNTLGWVPLGNTGGADVSPLKPMPVPAEFVVFFEGYDAKRHLRRRLILLAAIGIVVFAGLSAHRM